MRLCFVGLAMLGVVHAAAAGEIDPVLRGSNVPDAAPGYQIPPTGLLYADPTARPLSADGIAPGILKPWVPAAPASALIGGWRVEFGTRYWMSTGSLAKTLYDDPRNSSNINSRLTYSSLNSANFEGFGRVENSFGTFAKGVIGMSGLGSGTLRDEDFFPAVATYSSTLSTQTGGHLAYGSIDVGQVVVTNARMRGSVFAGYGYLAEVVNAYGCTQMAGNPGICVPAIPSASAAVTEDTHWNLARIGLQGELYMLDCLKLTAEAAWVPYAQIDAQDTHWLRLGTTPGSIAGPIPESGNGQGVQVEAILSYQVTDFFSFGVGGRYWYLQTKGESDFEHVIVGFPPPFVAQPTNFTTNRYGAFAQAAFRFGP
jgi:hypothetical protein